MPGWLAALDDRERRVLAAIAALVGVLALVVGGLALVDGDPGEASVRTGDEVGSTTSSSPTSAASSSSSPTSSSTTSTTLGSTTSTKAAAGSSRSTTTTARRSGGGGTGTTRPTATQPSTTTATTSPPSSGPCATGGGAAGQMASRFCAHRANLGLPSMRRNGALDAMAQEWAQKMANDGALSHRPSAQARQMVADRCDCPGWAENVAYDTTVDGAWTGWLNSSSGHRGHIEDPRDGEFGIGAVSAGGYLWFVQVFGYHG
ncbi:MAG TPA: CAP domain-containing protein [Acidimicrobiales bacterium]|nr:CAP domain-containing protein [Acidimicrobiales bacterium]